jgi:Fur family zinc uptake transcriptional regulator
MTDPTIHSGRAVPEQQDHADMHAHDGPCRHADARQAQAKTALARAESRCRQAGTRLTPIRRDVLDVLHSDHRPMGAYELVQRLASQKDRRIAPISVYRALDFLLEHGLVHRLSVRNAYIACSHDHAGGQTVAFLICEKCGGVDEDGSLDVGAALAGVTGANRFTARQQVVEITGFCEHCRGS